jgi:hypothetical protein
MDNTPYNTGKIKIGAYYVPRKTHYASDDESAFVHDLFFPHTIERNNRRAFIRTAAAIIGVVTLYILVCAYAFW